MSKPTLPTRLVAEFVGTFALVLFGCGTAIFAAVAPAPDKVQVGVGYFGVAVAFGLAVLVMAAAVGHVSGGHFNPAVTVGLAIAHRVEWRAARGYIITQLAAATVAAFVLFLIASSRPGFSAHASGFASNGYGDRSPGGYGLLGCLLAEVLLTAVFVYVILGATDHRAPQGIAPIAIGLTLTAVHLVSIPITNTSVNPARSFGVAWFAGAPALQQLWLFIVAPLLGAAISGLAYPRLNPEDDADAEQAEARVSD